MKKTLLVLLVCTFMGTAAYATPDRTGRFDAGVNVSAAMPTDGDLDGAVYVGGTAAYGFHEWFAAGIEAGWQEFDVDDAGFDSGDITGIPLLVDFILRIPVQDQPINPYAFAGVGMVFWEYNESSALSSFGVQVDVDNSFAVKVGGGFDWFLNDNWILNFEASYVFADADVDITSSTGSFSASDQIDMDYWTIGGGIKYLFG